jgi:hypothetical protein
LAVILIVFILGSAALGFLISKYYLNQSIEVKNQDSGLEITNKDLITQFEKQIQSQNKPTRYKIVLNGDMPPESENLVMTTNAKNIGQEGLGAGCADPIYSKNNQQVSFTFYATAVKLKEFLGEEKALNIINLIFRKCIRWAALSQSNKLEDMGRLTLDTQGVTEPILLKFK